MGVAALSSATKSAIVKSVSCPTAEIIGSSDLKIALATISVLKDHKSSIEPPPRQIIRVSTSFLIFAMLIALLIPSGAFSP